MRRLGFGSAIAVGAALLAGSLQGMAGIDERLEAAVQQPQENRTLVSEETRRDHRDCWKRPSDSRVEL